MNFKPPYMPPIASGSSEDAQPPQDNFLWSHYNDQIHKPHKLLDPPSKGPHGDGNPLVVDVFYSMRSPYSYLVLERLLFLHSHYNVNVTVRVILPVAVRAPGALFPKQEKGKVSGRWYKWADVSWDAQRVGDHLGVPFRFATPDPILQDTYPPGEATMQIAPLEKQPYILWITRLGAAAELAGKSNDYVAAVSPLIWGGLAPIGMWPEMVGEAFEVGTGLDYEATVKDIQENPAKYDALWSKHQDTMLRTGHGGVPNMVFRGEPFFGQDRFDVLFWRLQQNGLTRRSKPLDPSLKRPRTFPDQI